MLYVYRGTVRKYRPDFLARLTDGSVLVLETKGQDTEQDRVKRRYLDEWTQAVNAHGGFWAMAFGCDAPPRRDTRHSDAGRRSSSRRLTTGAAEAPWPSKAGRDLNDAELKELYAAADDMARRLPAVVGTARRWAARGAGPPSPALAFPVT